MFFSRKKKFHGKVVVIAPGCYGVGRAAAIQFASEGARVVIGGERPENGEEAVFAIRRAGGKARFVTCDLLNPEDIASLMERAVDFFGGIDVVFGCPDMFLPGAVADQATGDFDRMMKFNARSLFLLGKHAIPLIQQRGGGAVIFFSSIYGLVSGSMSCAYEASKASAIQLTRYLAERCAAPAVRVNCIVSGHVVSDHRPPATEGSPFLIEDSDEIARLSAYYPLGRLARPQEIAKVAVFLASEDSSFVTGAAIAVDGGFICR